MAKGNHMKAKLKLLLLVGTASFGLLGMACRAEAEETNQTGSGTVAAPESAATEGNASAQEVQEAAEPAAAEGDLPGTDAGDTNVVINQEITVLQEVPPTTPPNVTLSKGVEAIVKLAQSGVSETVILTFIETTEHEYNLDAPAILYLNDIGISSTVIASMLNHDGAPAELQDLIDDGTDLAEAPEGAPGETVAPISRGLLEGGYGAAQSAAPAAQTVEVTTNYVPAEAQTVVQQQPVVVEQPVVVQQPVVYTQPVVSHSYFYSSLAPYGSWIHVADYGWCWQPTIAVTHSGWRPYTHGGRWLWSDAGWYWQSDYSWGWAPFHYGRWFSSPARGWVWVPGYTWAPSWVTWRRTPYYCGWAPLPPRAHYRPGFGFTYFGRNVGLDFHFGLGYDHFSFVHKRDFCDRRLVHRVMPTARTINIYKESTVINNYVVGNNNTIINRGVDRDVIERHARTEIPKVGIRDIPAQPGRLVQPDRLRKQGSELVVFRPKPPSSELAAAATRAPSATPATRSEVSRPPSSSQLVRPGNAVTGRAALAAAERQAPPSGRTEVSRGAVSGSPVARPNTSAVLPGTPARQASRNPASATTWAKPTPFVPPPADTPVTPRTITRSETGRAALLNRSAGSQQAAATPNSRAAFARPTAPPSFPAARQGLAPGQTRSEAISRSSPWVNRNEGISRSATPAPSQSVTRQVTPSVQSRLGVTRPSTPALGNSALPGANVGTPTGRAAIYGTPQRAAPAPGTTTPVPQTRSIAPSQNSTPFNNPLAIRQAPVYVPQAPARPAQAPVTVPSFPTARQESISRPSVTPQPTGRAASPLYQPRTITPVPAPAPRIQPTQPSIPTRQPSFPSRSPNSFSPPVRSAPSVAPSRPSAPTGRAASPLYQSSPARQPSAPAATGRGRMEIRR